MKIRFKRIFFVGILLPCIVWAGSRDSSALNDLHNFYQSTINYLWMQAGQYKGSWHATGGKIYYNKTLHKYSGPTSTYTAKHAPLAVEKGNFTYFIVNGQQDEYPYYSSQEWTSYKSNRKTSPISMMIGKYDHVNNILYPPTTVHVKGTSDSHDNASINLDNDGYVYVFVSGRGSKRGGLIYKSDSVNSIDSFSLVYSGKNTIEDLDYDCDPNFTSNGWDLCQNEYRGFTYPQVWWSGNKFVLLHTIYLPMTYNDPNANPSYMRATYVSTVTPTPGSVIVSKPKKLIAVKGDYTKGHYSISKENNGTIGIAFNIHIKDDTTFGGALAAPHDNRTNLYFMYSKDGNDWFNINGSKIVSNILSSNTQNNGITNPSQLSSIAVREYHNPVTGKTRETAWCDNEYANLGKLNPNGYVCRRVYLKDIDFVVDSSGKPNRVEILYVANRSTEYRVRNNSTREFGAYPSPEIDATDIYLARYFYLSDGKGWQAERIRDSKGKDIVDHNYSSGTLTIENGQSYIISPASLERDGFAGQDQVKVFVNATGVKGGWSEKYSKYPTALASGQTANYVRSVHNSTSEFKVIWSEGPESEGVSKLFIGDLTNKKLELPHTSRISSSGQVVMFK